MVIKQLMLLLFFIGLQLAKGQLPRPAIGQARATSAMAGETITLLSIDNTSPAPIAFFYLDRFDNMGTITKPNMKGLAYLHKKILGNDPIVLRYSLQNLVVPFILMPGDSVAVGFSANGVPTVTYSQLGLRAAYNLFADMALVGPTLFTIANQFLTKPTFFAIDSLYKNDSTRLAAPSSVDKGLQVYYDMAQNYLQSQYYLYLLQRDKKLPPNTFVGQADNLVLHNFRELLTERIYIANSAVRKNQAAMMEAYYQAAMAAQGGIKNYLLYYTLKWMKNKNRPLYEKRKAAFVEHCADKEYVTDLVTEPSLSKQSGFYAFVDGSKRSFAEIVQTQKGKVLYIDVWASWCMPCRASMEASRLLQQQYANKGVTFVYASIDENLMAWKKALQEEGLAQWPHNYLIMDRLTNDFIKRFRIASIPRYLLYDAKGQLVDDNAPAPESPELVALLKRLLRK